MNSQQTIDLLSEWKKLLLLINDIEIDLEASPETLSDLISQRQNIITEIQAIDASLKEIGKTRSSGWKGFDDSSRKIAEELAESAIDLRDKISEKDAHTIDIATEKRSSILGQIKNTGLRSNYLKSTTPSEKRRPIIVDGKL